MRDEDTEIILAQGGFPRSARIDAGVEMGGRVRQPRKGEEV